MPDIDLLDGEMPNLTEYGNEEVVEPKVETPQYVTAADLKAFGVEMAAQIAAAMKPEVTKPNTAEPDWEEVLMGKAADTATARLLELNKGQFTGQIINEVAGDFPKNVQDEIRGILLNMTGQQVAGLTQSPNDLKQLARIAIGAHAQLNPNQKTIAPRSSASGSVSQATMNESELAKKFMAEYGDIGITKEQAMQMAKDRS